MSIEFIRNEILNAEPIIRPRCDSCGSDCFIRTCVVCGCKSSKLESMKDET